MHNDAYEKILSFLDSERPIKKEAPAPKRVEPPKEETRKQKASLNVKKLIEESEVHGYVPPSEKIAIEPSKGFDVKAFQAMMRSKLIDNHKRIQSYERPYISVTELCGCLRQSFYQRSKYPVDLKQQFNFSYLYLIQEVGNQIHSTILELYNYTEIEKTVVSEKYGVKGRVDGIRKRFLHEIKSIDTEKFQNRYLPEHFWQALCYAYILNTEYDGYEIDTIVLVYVMRNCKRIVPFDIPIDNEFAESILKRAPILKSSLDSKAPPDPIAATQEQCKYCLYRKYCEQDPCEEISQPFAKDKQKNKVKEKKKENKTAFLL